MKKMVFVLVLVALLLSLALPVVALAGCPAGDDPNSPGYGPSNGNAYQFLVGPPPGLFENNNDKAGDNWDWTVGTTQ